MKRGARCGLAGDALRVHARTRGWADLEAMAERRALDFPAVRAALRTMLGKGDARFPRLAEIERRSPA